MKKLLTLFLVTLGLSAALAQSSFPVSGTLTGTINNRVAVQSRNAGLSNNNESRQINNPVVVSTLGSAYINLYATMITGTGWQTTPNSTTYVANSLQQIPQTASVSIPDPGRKHIIREIEVSCNLPANILFQKQYNMASTLYGTTGAIAQGTVLQQFAKTATKADTQSVWTAKWAFPADDPLIVRYGERIIYYYHRNGVQQPNCRLAIIGRDKTNSDNETAPYRHLLFGDSKTAITPDGAGPIAQSQREFWPFATCDSLSANGYPTEPVNIAISGTTVSDWEFLARNGRFEGIPFSSWQMNLGTNDATVGASILSSGGVDGTFTTGLKYLITKLHALNPQAVGFINNIGPTDLTARQAALPGCRGEIAAVCTWAQAKGWPVYHIDNTAIFPTTDKTYFVATESAVNGSTHESSKGLMAEFTNMWPVIRAHMNQLKPAR